MDVFFNELSLPQTPLTRSEYIEKIERVLRVFSVLRNRGGADFKFPEIFRNYNQDAGYGLHKYLEDKNCDEDLRLLLKSQWMSSPTFEESYTFITDKADALHEFYYNNKECKGLALASEFTHDSFALGFVGADFPVNDCLMIDVCALDATFHPQTFTTSADHLVNTPSSNVWDKIERKAKLKIASGRDIITHWKTLFPNLILSKKAEKQLKKYPVGAPEVFSIKMLLNCMQRYCENWKDKAFLFNQMQNYCGKISPESETRLRDFKAELTCIGENREEILLSWHGRFKPGAGRIHFHPYPENKQLLIGSVANQNEIK